MTLAWLDKLGIPYTNDNFTHYTVYGGNTITAFDYTVPGDFSSIAYPLATAVLTQSSLRITHIDMQDVQGDRRLIEVLIDMGANISFSDHTISVQPGSRLQGCDIDVNAFIDAVPILAVIGCFAEGRTRLLNAAIARQKESDRLSAITQELSAMGANMSEQADSLTIYPSVLSGATLQSHQDHRIAMALVVAAAAAGVKVLVNDVDCIRKSYPDFDRDMRAIGVLLDKTDVAS